MLRRLAAPCVRWHRRGWLVSDERAEFVAGPFVDQRRWTDAAAFADVSCLDVVEVTGADSGRFLSALWSQRLDVLVPGDSVEALLLSPTGRVEAQAAVVCESPGGFVLIMDPGQGAHIAEWLDSMRFLMQVEVRDVSARWDVFALSPVGLATLPEDFVPSTEGVRVLWADPWARVAEGGAQYSGANPARDAWQLGLAVVARELSASVTGHLLSWGFARVGWGAVEASRIVAWRPRFATEADDRLLPHEVDWLRTAIHLSKGCYRGQEAVAKVHNLGKPPRRLVFLHLDGSEGLLPDHGDDVLAVQGDVIGHVTSAARHEELGPVALALVKRAVPEDAALSVLHDGVVIAASQEVVVLPDAGGAAVESVAAFRASRRGG